MTTTPWHDHRIEDGPDAPLAVMNAVYHAEMRKILVESVTWELRAARWKLAAKRQKEKAGQLTTALTDMIEWAESFVTDAAFEPDLARAKAALARGRVESEE